MRSDLRLALVIFGGILIFTVGPAVPHLVAQALTPDVPVADPLGESWAIPMWAYLGVKALELLKRSAWFPMLGVDTEKWLQNLWGAGVALAATLGIHYTYDGATGTLTIVGLTGTALWEFVRQFGLQQVLYTVLYRGPDKPAAIA